MTPEPEAAAPFPARHTGPRGEELAALLAAVGFPSLEAFIDRAVPAHIRRQAPLALPPAVSESEAQAELHRIADRNERLCSMIGWGYHAAITPPVIRRHLFENPGWYTAYTPYQPEISQGRLEMLFHFQTLVCELAGFEIANASLLDEATAAAEAVSLAYRAHRGRRRRVVIAGRVNPQTDDVLHTRARTIGIDLVQGACDSATAAAIGADTAAILIPWPAADGQFAAPESVVTAARRAGALVIVIADPLALTLLAAPGAWGADVMVGSMQRFGVPMGCGGPHAACLATRRKHVRLTPGRIVGRSRDRAGRPAFRLALQTREQHIRRERATSNICTAQALLANMAAAFAIWHGPEGLQAIAGRVHHLAARLAAAAEAAGRLAADGPLFDTVLVASDDPGGDLRALREAGILGREAGSGRIALAFDERTGEAELQSIGRVLGLAIPDTADSRLPAARRGPGFLTQSVFHAHRSETSMMRYLQLLARRDLSLDRTMIPLGSCTMKLNAVAEMEPVGWPEFADVHPFAPADCQQGYRQLADDLRRWLAEITGFDAVSLQPNAGSQGEYAGLLAIRRYLEAKGESARDICLIPDSAHGTNPASANLAGMEVAVVASLESGEIDIDDLRRQIEAHRDRVAAFMITYPSTRGVFEGGIHRACELVHAAGGQVYLDGANLNAMTGIARPGDIGADACHMNLHKTFCIPHGGGGPGMGPIGVKAHLAPFLPGFFTEASAGAVSGAALGSAGILPITWMYLRMMGGEGLRQASAVAMLAANYISCRLADTFPTAFRGAEGLVAHECILDPRAFRAATGVTAEDIAKRLIDHGFHGPTMEWPVAGTLMVEPTESESKAELDRFCDAMLSIAAEIRAVEAGDIPAEDNPLANAPHTLADVTADNWSGAYSRQQALFPGQVDPRDKYLPPVSRVDNAYGDRHLECADLPQGVDG